MCNSGIAFSFHVRIRGSSSKKGNKDSLTSALGRVEPANLFSGNITKLPIQIASAETFVSQWKRQINRGKKQWMHCSHKLDEIIHLYHTLKLYSTRKWNAWLKTVSRQIKARIKYCRHCLNFNESKLLDTSSFYNSRLSGLIFKFAFHYNFSRQLTKLHSKCKVLNFVRV